MCKCTQPRLILQNRCWLHVGYVNWLLTVLLDLGCVIVRMGILVVAEGGGIVTERSCVTLSRSLDMKTSCDSLGTGKVSRDRFHLNKASAMFRLYVTPSTKWPLLPLRWNIHCIPHRGRRSLGNTCQPNYVLPVMSSREKQHGISIIKMSNVSLSTCLFRYDWARQIYSFYVIVVLKKKLCLVP